MILICPNTQEYKFIILLNLTLTFLNVNEKQNEDQLFSVMIFAIIFA